MIPLRAPGRPRGYAKTGGRKPGTKNRRTKEVEEALRPLVPAAKKKLKALIASEDDKTAYMAAMAVLSYVFGKPIDRQQLGGIPGGVPLIEPTRYDELYGKVEVARRVAFVLAGGLEASHELDKMAAEEPETPPVTAPAGEGSGGASPTRKRRDSLNRRSSTQPSRTRS